jgi:hypothetical protein
MNGVAEIKAAIARLSLAERAELAAELCGWEDDDWDRQMKIDAASGKFTTLNQQALADAAAGRTIPLDEILREP